jgi:MFS transporter, DHA1 family, tetracycline resistance protein
MEQRNAGPGAGSNSAATVPLLLLILIDSMGFGILIPLLASALAPESDSVMCRDFSQDHRYLIYGFTTGLYPMMIFFGAPILGQLSDRVGRKRILQLCAAGIVLGYLLVSTAFALGSVLLLMIGRILGGAAGGSRAISMAALADICSPRNKDFWLSMGLLASSSGFVIGSALSGVLANNRIVSWFTVHTPLHVTVLLAAVDFALLSWLFEESRRTRSPEQPRFSLTSGIISVTSAFRNRGLREVSWVFLFQALGRGAYFFFIAHFIMDSFDVTSTNVSLFMSLLGVGPCLSFAIIMPLLRKRYSTRAIASWSLLATAVLIVASALAPTMMLEWCLILPISITIALSYAGLVILFTDRATQGAKGEIFGVTAAIKAFAFGMIAFAGGGMQTLDESVPMIASFLLMTVSWILFQTQIPKTAIQGVESRWRVAKA